MVQVLPCYYYQLKLPIIISMLLFVEAPWYKLHVIIFRQELPGINFMLLFVGRSSLVSTPCYSCRYLLPCINSIFKQKLPLVSSLCYYLLGEAPWYQHHGIICRQKLPGINTMVLFVVRSSLVSIQCYYLQVEAPWYQYNVIICRQKLPGINTMVLFVG